MGALIMGALAAVVAGLVAAPMICLIGLMKNRIRK